MQSADRWDVLIIGAGPAGLAAAAAAQKSGLTHLILEKSCLAGNIQQFPTNLKFFSTPELLELADVPFIIADDKPRRTEVLHYYRRFAEAKRLNVHTYEEVVEVGRTEAGFRVRSRTHGGEPREYAARHVIVATGAYAQPRRLNVPGEDLPKISHYYREPHLYYGCEVLVVGGRHSAAEAALDIHRAGGHVTLSYRRDRFQGLKYWIQPDLENRVREGSIRCYFNSHVREIKPSSVVLEIADGERVEIDNDFVLALTGYEPDVAFLERMGIQVDPETRRPRHDPATFETNVPGLYVAGVICAGNVSSEIFIENGRYHGEAIVRHILRRNQ